MLTKLTWKIGENCYEVAGDYMACAIAREALIYNTLSNFGEIHSINISLREPAPEHTQSTVQERSGTHQ